MGVTVEVVGNAAVVTMAWTEKRNALGPDEADVLDEALRRAGESEASAVVLTGTGAFCSGGDLRVFGELSRTCTPEQLENEVYDRVQAVLRTLRRCPLPTIAAVDGPAVGLGFDLALACDMRFVGPRGWLQQGWARAGLVPGAGGVGLLNRLAPGLVWELLAHQGRLGPEECERLRLGVASTEPALDAAVARADALATIPRDVLGHYAALDRATTWPEPAHFGQAARIQSTLLSTDRFRTFVDSILGQRR